MAFNEVIRIAHRGASGKGLAPENTLPAFEKALQIGTDAVEIDVHLTRDGHVVVIHDDTLDRTTDRTGAISELTLEEIKAADAGIWFNPSFRGTRGPTLEEALDLLKGKALVLVEIKADGITENVVTGIEQMKAQGHVILQSFNAQTVQEVAQINPSLPTALLTGSRPKGNRHAWAIHLAHRLSLLHANLLTLEYKAATPQVLRELHLRGFAVWVWTVDEIADLNRAVALPVEGIISNYPDRLNDVLAAKAETRQRPDILLHRKEHRFPGFQLH